MEERGAIWWVKKVFLWWCLLWLCFLTFLLHNQYINVSIKHIGMGKRILIHCWFIVIQGIQDINMTKWAKNVMITLLMITILLAFLGARQILAISAGICNNLFVARLSHGWMSSFLQIPSKEKIFIRLHNKWFD